MVACGMVDRLPNASDDASFFLTDTGGALLLDQASGDSHELKFGCGEEHPINK